MLKSIKEITISIAFNIPIVINLEIITETNTNTEYHNDTKNCFILQVLTFLSFVLIKKKKKLTTRF